MKSRTRTAVGALGAIAILATAESCARGTAASGSTNQGKGNDMTSHRPELARLDETWKKTLTAEQYEVTRHAATERPFGAAYEQFQKQGAGTYYCICCGAELFTSKEKFHSGCGWPSFYDASTAKNVAERKDRSMGVTRTEVVCRRCDAHLGHVFDHEGFKTPTDRRFCINAASMQFVATGGAAPKLLDVGSAEVAAKKDEVAKQDAPADGK